MNLMSNCLSQVRFCSQVPSHVNLVQFVGRYQLGFFIAVLLVPTLLPNQQRYIVHLNLHIPRQARYLYPPAVNQFP